MRRSADWVVFTLSSAAKAPSSADLKRAQDGRRVVAEIVKTPRSNLRKEISSRLRQSKEQQRWRPLSGVDNRENNSARSSRTHVFTQPRSFADIIVTLATVCSCYNSRHCYSQTQFTYPVRRPSLLPIKPLIGSNPMSVAAPISDLTRTSRDVSDVPLTDISSLFNHHVGELLEM